VAEYAWWPPGDESSIEITSTHATEVLISATTDPASVAGPAEHSVEPGSRNGPTNLPCRSQDPDLWFSDSPAHLHLAKSFCADCPARTGCLAGAVRRREPWGVWGGEIFQQGRIITEKRARGRPRKHHIAA
jgi:WhiB family redox-sensing transcriptional regulator